MLCVATIGMQRACRASEKNFSSPDRSFSPLVAKAWVQVTFVVSCVRACHLAQCSRAAWYRPSRTTDQAALRLRIRELAHVRPRFGVLRIWVLLRREGWLVNKKRVRRLYIASRGYSCACACDGASTSRCFAGRLYSANTHSAPRQI